MSEPRRVNVVIRATVELGPQEHYAPGSSVDEQIRADMDADPAAFVLYQIEDMDIEVRSDGP